MATKGKRTSEQQRQSALRLAEIRRRAQLERAEAAGVLRDSGSKVSAIAALMKVHKATVHRWLKLLDASKWGRIVA